MKSIEFTEDDIVDQKNRHAPFDGRMLPRNGKGAEYRTGKCAICGKRSYPYYLCRSHREKHSIKRVMDKLVDSGDIERLTDGRGSKGGAKYKNANAIESKPFIRNDARIGRNEPCKCGSGKKYKKCCLIKQQPKDKE